MADLIDRETVRRAYEKSLENDNHIIAGASAIHMQEHRHMLHILDKIPAVDAVEVVRCGECKHCDFGVYLTTICTSRNNVVTKEGFCNRGERREDNAPD